MSRSATHDARCPHLPEPTEQQRADAAEIAANGGTLTLAELVHSQAFAYVGCSWTRQRAERSIREHQAENRTSWVGAHAHPDGSIYVPRAEQ